MNYRAGIIGTGGIAGMGILGMHDEKDIGVERFTESHAGGYEANDQIDLVAVSDIDEERVHRFGEAWGIEPENRFTSHEMMLEHADLDILSVCTPTYLHHQHVIDAARIAPDLSIIWCEKPIASGISDAEDMMSACLGADIELVVNHSFRFTSKLQALQKLIQEGLVGDIRTINAIFRRELLRNSTHLIDTVMYLLDTTPARATGYINGENDAVTALQGDREVDDSGGGGFVIMEDGTFVTIDCTVARDISSMAIQVIGTEGKLYLNNDDGDWRYWNLDDGEHVERPIPGIDGAWSWEEDYRGSFRNAAEHLVELLEGSANNHSPGEEATISLEVITAFYVSHYTNSQVDFPLDRPLKDVTITSW